MAPYPVIFITSGGCWIFPRTSKSLFNFEFQNEIIPEFTVRSDS